MSTKLQIKRERVFSFLKIKHNTIIDVNESFLDLTGYFKSEILGEDFKEFCVEKLRLTFDIISLTRGIKRTKGFLFTKDLKPREIFVYCNSIGESGKIKTFVFKELRDTTIEEKFPYIDQLYSYNVSGVAIFAITPDIVLLKANETFLDFLDNPFNKKENSIGKKIHEIITGWQGSSSERIWKKVIRTGEYFYLDEYRYDRFDRGVTYWKVTLMPIKIEGKVKFVIEMTEEITERVINRKRIVDQALMIKKQRDELEVSLKMKDEFLTIVSHEFKTPLNVINSAVQVMELVCGNELSDKAVDFLDKIKQNTLRQLRLVNNVLDMTKINNGKIILNKENIDIVYFTETITQSARSYAKQKGIEVSFDAKVKQIIIGIDDEKYERILLNLLSNAIKFTTVGGKIFVTVSQLKDKVFIEVEDTGTGVPEDKQEAIFERFGQVDNSLSRQAEGTGIGLSLVKALVQAMDGSILLNSMEGKGSRFTVSLPLVRLETDNCENVRLDDFRLTQAIKTEFSDIYL
ncbi:MAG: PAS domain-containing sensor histidine kinase [Firmicutes bacterium]|nr:PAS domain-containing sensor histidine kinase [Bacillota bacterium]